jgi:SAM-dependent methyltransferase
MSTFSKLLSDIRLAKSRLRNPMALLFKISPWLYRFLIYRGWIAEKKWTDLTAEKFESYIADDHPDREWFVEWVMSKRPCSVLEVGAGGMHEARRLKARGALGSVRYSVIDVAKNFLVKGREEFPEIDFVEGSLNQMRFANDSFDIVYCRAVLEHQPYYEKPVSEMFRVARHFVVINLFRWSLHRDIIRRAKYYSNAYKIDDFLAYIKKVSVGYDHFLVLKGEVLGANRYEDENIRRTGDHLVVVAAKHPGVFLDNIYETLDRLGNKYIPHPYDGKIAI